MSSARPAFPLSRRSLIAGAASLVAAGPALAQSRRDPFFDDPYAEPEGFWPRSRPAPPPGRDRFYDTQVQEDYYRPDSTEPGSGDADPYGQYPYGSRRRARDGARGPVETPVADGSFEYRRIYGRLDSEPFPIPAFDFRRVGPDYLRREVAYRGREPAGAIVVDPNARHLYFVQGGGRAIRYGVGVGRQGFAWSGTATVNAKQEWPDWYPPKEMIARDPKLARSLSDLQSGIGMHGGPRNPLGARALYLWQGNKDTLYRIHGTTEPWTIGTRASSGCIRMVNQDAIDLYNRASVGAEVVVLG